MSGPAVQKGGADTTAPSFLGLRSRVQTLYRARRRSVLEVPTVELQRRYGAAGHRVDVDDVDYRAARVDLDDDMVIEVGFKGTFRIFGALIDTQIVGRQGQPDDPVRFDYRFDREAFTVPGARRGSGEARESLALQADALVDSQITELAARCELKKMSVLNGRTGGRQVELIPLAGTITAVYFPPLPPYTVALKPSEVRDQLELVERLLAVELPVGS